MEFCTTAQVLKEESLLPNLRFLYHFLGFKKDNLSCNSYLSNL